MACAQLNRCRPSVSVWRTRTTKCLPSHMIVSACSWSSTVIVALRKEASISRFTGAVAPAASMRSVHNRVIAAMGSPLPCRARNAATLGSDLASGLIERPAGDDGVVDHRPAARRSRRVAPEPDAGQHHHVGAGQLPLLRKLQEAGVRHGRVSFAGTDVLA